MEANPDSMKTAELKLLRKEGVNRLSIGVQSANNDILKLIGRRHNFKQAENAVKSARDAGFDNISLDLIYGLPSQSRADWADTLSKAIALKPEHISCYGLKLEEGTPMYKEYGGSPLIPDDDAQADMYLFAVERLGRYGYKQYEISNFAIPGYESRHNLKYWLLEDYMGFGPGAASGVGSLRYSYVKDLEAYISGMAGGRSIIDEYEKITPMERASEYIMLGMRTARGITAGEYRAIYLSEWEPIEKLMEAFEARGWAEKHGERWAFTPSGFLVSNQLIGALLEAQAGERVQTNPWMQPAFEKQEKQELPPDDVELFRASLDKI
jgi:putative oxygen-independent coproporphyrinogen III oxidase